MKVTGKDLPVYVEDLFKRARDRKSVLHDEWWTAHSFVDGDQYITFRNGRSQEAKSPSWRVRLTQNMLLPIVNTICAKLTQQRPGILVRPSSPDEDRIQKAKACEKLLDYLDRLLKLDRVRYEVCWWAVVTGSGFFRRYWDPDAGNQYTVDYEGVTQVIETGGPKVDAFSPFDVYPDVQATSMDDARWVILAHMLSAQDLEDRWPKAGKKIIQQSGGTGAPVNADDDSALRRDVSGYVDDPRDDRGLYRVLEYEEKPTVDYPDGRRVITCQNQLLEEGDLPGRRFSLAMVRYSTMGGRFWGKGVVTPLVPLQRELNRTVSQMVELRNLHANPVWVGPTGSVPNNAVTNRPDSFITYNPNLGPPPQRIDPVPIPNSLETMSQSIKQAFFDISGVHEISQGRQPSGVVSGRAMGMLADQDATKLGPAVRSLELAMEDLARGLLEDWREYQFVPVTVTVVGPSRIPEVFRFSSDQIDSTDVEIIAGSMLYKHPSYVRELALQYFQMGALGSPQEPSTQMRFRQILGSRGLEEFYDDDSPDRNYARQENDMLTSPAVAPEVRPAWFEDHVVHVDEHRKFMLSTEFRELSKELQEGFSEHLALHYHELAKQGAGQATYAEVLGLEAEAGQGGAPPPGGPPQGGPPQGMPPQMEQMAQPQGGMSGGTPEINQAFNIGGPGVNATEEAGGFQ